MGVEAEGEGPGEEENYRCADGCGEVAVDVFDAYFGEQRGCGGEEGREKRPEDPAHGVNLRI
jgi:hypothetical protein